MANPVTINYLPSDTQYIANTQASPALNQSLVLNSNYVYQDISSGVSTPAVKLPIGQARQLKFTAANLGGSQNLRLIVRGKNAFNVDESESISLTSGTPVVYSIAEYVEVYSVTVSLAAAGSTISVGYGDYGYTTLFPLDVWNKNSSYTVSVTNQSGTIAAAFTLLYTVQDIYITNADKQVVPNPIFTLDSNDNPFINWYYAFPLNNANVIISGNATTPTSWPITLGANQTISFSAINIPMTGITAYVNSSNPGDSSYFDITILQQGGRY